MKTRCMRPSAELGAKTEAMMHSDISLEELFALFGESEDDVADGEQARVDVEQQTDVRAAVAT